MTGQPPDLLGDVWRHGRDGVIVVRLDPHDARLLGRPKADGEHGPERDRNLPEDVPRVALADDSLDPVDELDRLYPTLEHGEERALPTLVHRVLVRREADIGRYSGKPLAVTRIESREDGDLTDLIRRHHPCHRRPDSVRASSGAPADGEQAWSRPARHITGQRYCVAADGACGASTRALLARGSYPPSSVLDGGPGDAADPAPWAAVASVAAICVRTMGR